MATRFYIDGLPPGLTHLDQRWLDDTRTPLGAWTTQGVTAGGDGVSYYADLTPPDGAAFLDWSQVGQAASLGYPEQIDVDVPAALPSPPTLGDGSLPVPTNLVALNGEGVTQLMWDGSAPGFNVYASTDGGPYLKVNTDPVTNPVYTVPVKN